MKKLEEMLKRHEGLRLDVYRDSLGNKTIGYGHLIQGPHLIDKDMAERLLRYDMHLAVDAFFTLPTEIRINLNENRRRVLMNMIFNLGLPKLLGFKKMLKAIENDDYDGAADEMLDSRWAKQVRGRAIELADIMRRGN